MTHPPRTESTLHVTSPAFKQGEPIPKKNTCQAADVSPPLVIADVPGDAKALAIILDDPDAPGGTFDHWLAWNLPAGTGRLDEGVDIERLGGQEGRNGFGRTGYSGPCPPVGDVHRYFFRVHALSRPLNVSGGAGRDQLEAALKGHSIALGELMGTYRRE